MTNIDCPDCGRRIELDQSGIIPYHDNGSPIVCAGSGRQVSAASTQPSCTWCDAPAACIAGSESRRIYETQAETLRAAIDAIRARSKDGAR